MDTRQKILKQSLYLFNHKGIDHVSLRSISNELNISVGNLQYHFKKREDIIHELYFQLVTTIDNAIKNSTLSHNALEELFTITNVIATSFYEYRFIFQDFNSVMNSYPKIKRHYQELLKNRRQQFLLFVDGMIENGLMEEETLPDEHSNLFTRVQILSDFWLSAAKTQSKLISKSSVSKYTEMINQTVFPYLTSLGKEKYYEASQNG